MWAETLCSRPWWDSGKGQGCRSVCRLSCILSQLVDVVKHHLCLHISVLSSSPTIVSSIITVQLWAQTSRSYRFLLKLWAQSALYMCVWVIYRRKQIRALPHYWCQWNSQGTFLHYVRWKKKLHQKCVSIGTHTDWNHNWYQVLFEFVYTDH